MEIHPAEYILIGIFIMACMVSAMQVKAALRRGEIHKYSYGEDPYKYLIGPMPEGTFSANQPFKKAFMWFGGVLSLMGFGWLAVNVPELRTLAFIYLGMAAITLPIYLAEEISPKRTEVTACMLLGYGEWDKQVLYGLITGIVFVVVNSFFQVMQFHPFQIKEMLIASFMITVIMVPIVEEGLFRGILAPSIAEDAGILHGALVSAFVFAMFHAYTYSYNWLYILNAFIFGSVVAFIDFKFKSILPGAIAHSFVNFFAFITWLNTLT